MALYCTGVIWSIITIQPNHHRASMEPLVITAVGSLVYLAIKHIFSRDPPPQSEQERNNSFYQSADDQRLNLTFRTNLSSDSEDSPAGNRQSKPRLTNKQHPFRLESKKEVNNKKYEISRKLIESRYVNQEEEKDGDGEAEDQSYRAQDQQVMKEGSISSQNRSDKDLPLFKKKQNNPRSPRRHNNPTNSNQKRVISQIQHEPSCKFSTFQDIPRINLNMMKILSTRPKNAETLIEAQIQNYRKRREASSCLAQEQTFISSIEKEPSPPSHPDSQSAHY